MFAGIIKVFIL